MKKTLLILLLMATARAHESPVAAPTAAPVSRLTEAEQKKIFEEAEAAYVEKNYARALELYQRLAAAGHAGAMGSLGFMYKNGEGVAKDYASAIRWLEKAGAAGDRDGYGWISLLYEQGGPGLEQDYASAKRWTKRPSPPATATAIGRLACFTSRAARGWSGTTPAPNGGRKGHRRRRQRRL